MTNEELAELLAKVKYTAEHGVFDAAEKSMLADMEVVGTALQSLAAQLAEARAENARLREALRVYAGPMEWTQEGGWGAFPVWADGYPGGVYVDDNTLDYGDAARAALEQGEDAILRAERNEP